VRERKIDLAGNQVLHCGSAATIGDKGKARPCFLLKERCQEARTCSDDCRRSRQVIALCGDGGFNMLLCEFLTAVQHKLPVKAVVYDNSAFGLITLEAEGIGVPAWYRAIDFPNPVRIPMMADSDSDRSRTAFRSMADRIPIDRGQRSDDRGQLLPST
jgi:hypothetical protein